MIELWLHSSVTREPKQRNAQLTIESSLDESSLHESKKHETDQGKKASHHVVGALFRHGLLHRLPELLDLFDLVLAFLKSNASEYTSI